MESYTTIKQYSCFEYEDRKSVFIGEAMPVTTEAEALGFIERIKKTYPDARHHVFAYVLRENSIMRFSDDHEPQGTAGMPVLDVIRKNGCTDTVIVVTRYFGGTLLGTGGLVRAYTSAALGALNGGEIIEYGIYAVLEIESGYSDYQKISGALSEYGFRTEDTVYAENIKISGSIKKDSLDRFMAHITETSSGRVGIKVIEEKFDC